MTLRSMLGVVYIQADTQGSVLHCSAWIYGTQANPRERMNETVQMRFIPRAQPSALATHASRENA